MFIAVILTLVMASPYLVWQFFIRPYCLKNGKGYTAGTNWAATMWVDWQDAKELGVARGDGKIICACQFFLWINILFALGMVLLIVTSIASG